MATRIPGARRLSYALGHPGFQITDRIVVVMAVYFYLPPPGRGLEAQVREEAFLGFLTVYGLATLVARFFDAAADPLVAYASDRSRSRLGRRRSLLVYGILPMVAVPVALFFPPAEPGSWLNGLWLGGLLALYFVAFTAYVAPYLALLPELAWSETERLRLSQWMSFTSLPVLALVSAWGLGLDLGRDAGLSATEALRWLVVALSLLSLVLCLGPILAVNEKRYARATRSELPLREALLTTMRNRPFLIYLLAQLCFILGISLVHPSFPYLATVILGRSEGFTIWFSAAGGVGIVLGFAVQRPLVRRIGPKRVIMACLAVMTAGLALLGLLEPDVPGGPRDGLNLVLCFVALGLFGIPAAGFLVLPHVLISQLIDEDERRTGASRAAMFFGMQGFFTKWMYGISLWLFTLLLSRYGNSPEEPGGVILIGPVAAACSLLALVVYSRYPEREVRSTGSE